jgi:hypothetical protein
MSLSSLVLSNETRSGNFPSTVVVYVIRDERCSLDHPLGDAIEVLIRREDADSERLPRVVASHRPLLPVPGLDAVVRIVWRPWACFPEAELPRLRPLG